MKSSNLQLSRPMISLLERHGIITATPVQQAIIPAIVAGKDVLAQSETGSGKTLSFAIPIIEALTKKDGLAVLVLVPTRELCVQVANEFVKFSEGKHLGVNAIYGGVSMSKQISKLSSTNIVVATPGRLIDLLDRRTFNLESVKYLVLDEADRMLDMGFIKDIENIIKRVKGPHQTMLFSATVAKEVVAVAKKYLHDPEEVHLASEVKPDFLHQTYYRTTRDEKIPLLVELLKRERDLTLVFCNRKHVTARIAKKLTASGLNARCLHGDMTQAKRESVTAEFKKKRFNILVATDVASRGLHIDDISHVYNYEIPKDVDSYTHRIGRTARAGKSGEAISLVAGSEEEKFFKDILFSYRGKITLLGGIDLPPQPQENGERQERRASAPRESRGQGNRQGKPRNDREGRGRDSRENRSGEARPSREGRSGEGRPSRENRSGETRPGREGRGGEGRQGRPQGGGGGYGRPHGGGGSGRTQGGGPAGKRRDTHQAKGKDEGKSRDSKVTSAELADEKKSWRKKWQSLFGGK